ncbi:MAG: primosomal protein N' [Lachnospiraceae bacterium]|nr:primosomal protein N' [Lachnospiraceae bacterium]
MYGNIIVDITHEKLDKIFQYHVPPHLDGKLEIGMELAIPFGVGNRQINGYLIGFSETCDFDPEKIKDIIGISTNRMAIEGRLVALAVWMKEYYGGTLIQALKTVIPIKKKEKSKEKKRIRLLLDLETAKEKLVFFESKNQKARARLLQALIAQKEHGTDCLEYQLVSGKLNVALSVIRALEEQKILVLESDRVFRNPVQQAKKENWSIDLTAEQAKAFRLFQGDYATGNYATYLLHGVTGSGKTEVYMEMIRQVVGGGGQAIVLIPEIALTYQTVLRFYRCFGDRVSIINSRLTPGERYDQMQRAKEGKIDVMIGPRSALFTPFPALGLIVIDEEHESTYKSEQTPRFHVRETAIKRGEVEGASVVLGSATPSLEAMYRVNQGEYKLLELTKRSGEQAMAKVQIVDMREELQKGNRSILSNVLSALIADRLQRQEQVMLFLNRRGFAGFVSCRTCGHVIKCNHCDVSLSVHRNERMLCHYCGYEEKKPEVCPLCNSPHIGVFQAGTQQIEDLVKKKFPTARVLRMDMDTTKVKDSHEKILSTFANEEADILIGTQMIVKGHDFPNVTLVGVLAADMSLYSADYRAGERTFQLLTQAVGRAGRGEKKGDAIVQTYSPDHYAILTAAAQDYDAFYQKEMGYRRWMGYPPAENLLAVYLSGKDEIVLETAGNYLKKFANKMIGTQDVKIIGPASPGIGKINDVYRKVLYLKASNYGTLIKIKNKMEQYIEINSGFNRIRIQFDFNPMHVG